MSAPTSDQLSAPPWPQPRKQSRGPAAERIPAAAPGSAAPVGAIALSVAGLLLLVLIGAAAPNDHTLDSRMPLLALPALPVGGTSTFLTLAAIAAQGIGLLGLLRAAARGWRPPTRRLLGAGAVGALLLCLVTPVGSADVASYAAYGRIAALGGSPYLTAPADLGGGYARLVSSSWQHTPSVYGPLATWVQQLAATIGGDRPMLTIWLLMLANAAVYLLTGLLLVRIAPDRTRAALLWAANPLLLGQLVGGGHLDTYMALFAACAVYVALRARHLWHEVLIGVLLGLTCGVKISAGLLAVGLSWPLLRARDWRRLGVRVPAAVLTLVALYAPVGLGALDPLSDASQMVSVPSLWQLVRWAGHSFPGPAVTAELTSVTWPLLMLLFAWLIHREFTRRHAGSAPPVLVAAFALALGWLLAAPWCMPWYAALAWPLAALLPRARTDVCLLLLTLALALCHNTGGHGWSW
ncbi:hypothetical protein GXW82_15765 [Streptacidiphilus sp. 4-A2]|nr:hypothetical protein [Streptacidiphilus sp. 4-A2]